MKVNAKGELCVAGYSNLMKTWTGYFTESCSCLQTFPYINLSLVFMLLRFSSKTTKKCRRSTQKHQRNVLIAIWVNESNSGRQGGSKNMINCCSFSVQFLGKCLHIYACPGYKQIEAHDFMERALDIRAEIGNSSLRFSKPLENSLCVC